MADLKNDIDKYLKGELTPSEMHALEKKALQDPFLEEALEGARQITPDLLEEDLKSLQASLRARVLKKEGKVIPFWVWPARIAAGLSLIAVATILVINLTKDQRSEDLVVKEETTSSVEKDKQQESVVADSIEESKEEAENKGPLTNAKPDAPKSKSVAPLQAEQQKEDGRDTPAASETLAETTSQPQAVTPAKTEEVLPTIESIAEDKIAQAEPETTERSKKSAPGVSRFSDRDDRKEAARASGLLQSKDKEVNSRVIKGQVKSEDGAGLPGVNVMIKGTNIGTVTDASGNYQISLDQQNTSLAFSFIGFMSTEVEAGQKDQVDVQLNEDVSQLSEVVVVGYGAETKSDDDLSSNLEFAAPAGGRKAFKQYLEKNLHYPEQALENKVEGKVTIQFSVESSGQLSDFKVIRGIGNGCDEEVIRLIKQGPTWTPTKRNNDSLRDRVKVRMKFELPKK